MDTKTRKILWCVDAFEEEAGIRSKAARAIEELSRHLAISVEPVFILSPAELNLSVEFTSPWLEQYLPVAEKALSSWLATLGIPSLTEPKVLLEKMASTSHAVDALGEHAIKEGAELIVCASHGRSGVSRMLLGSFAEALLLKSPVPVMVVGPRSAPELDMKKIVLPTEFGNHSKLMFRHAVGLARELDAEVHLFHSILHPVAPIFQTGVYLLGGSWVPVQAYFSDEARRQQRHADAWESWAKAKGVRAVSTIDTHEGSIADEIVRVAEEDHAGLILMEAQSGPIASSLLGSITRQVVRHAPCPVWVTRPELLAMRRPAAPATPAA